jgi:PKD repeat protein
MHRLVALMGQNNQKNEFSGINKYSNKPNNQPFMLKLNFLLLLPISAFLFACNKEEPAVAPTPDFSIAEEFYAIEEPIQLTNESSTAATYKWDFGNGTTSTERQPQPITYSQPGNYTIKLTTSYLLNRKMVETTVEKAVKIGQYFAYEVQLLSYVENYMLEGGSHAGPSEGNPDVYLKILSHDDGVLYQSEVRPGITRADLPLSWPVDRIALGKHKNYTPLIQFYDHNEDKEDRLIAHSIVAGGSMADQFDRVKNEGRYAHQRGTDDWGSHVVVKYRIELPQ